MELVNLIEFREKAELASNVQGEALKVVREVGLTDKIKQIYR